MRKTQVAEQSRGPGNTLRKGTYLQLGTVIKSTVIKSIVMCEATYPVRVLGCKPLIRCGCLVYLCRPSPLSSWPNASLGTTRIPVWPLQSMQDLGVYCYKYMAWYNGARELYDLWTDPFETIDRCRGAGGRRVCGGR